MSTTCDGLQLRDTTVFGTTGPHTCRCTTTGTKSLPKNCTWSVKFELWGTCLCCTTGMSKSCRITGAEHTLDCWKLSLMSAGTSATLSRKRNARKALLPLLLLPHRPPPFPPLDQLRPLPQNRRETGGEALGTDSHQRVHLGIKLVVERLICQFLLPLPPHVQ